MRQRKKDAAVHVSIRLVLEVTIRKGRLLHWPTATKYKWPAMFDRRAMMSSSDLQTKNSPAFDPMFSPPCSNVRARIHVAKHCTVIQICKCFPACCARSCRRWILLSLWRVRLLGATSCVMEYSLKRCLKPHAAGRVRHKNHVQKIIMGKPG